ncbi:hypothetical protein [Microbulbifer agarilyticus]
MAVSCGAMAFANLAEFKHAKSILDVDKGLDSVSFSEGKAKLFTVVKPESGRLQGSVAIVDGVAFSVMRYPPACINKVFLIYAISYSDLYYFKVWYTEYETSELIENFSAAQRFSPCALKVEVYRVG